MDISRSGRATLSIVIPERLVASQELIFYTSAIVKDTVSPAERCDFVVVKLEKVHELFQVCRICGKGVMFYHMAQYGLLYHKSLCN